MKLKQLLTDDDAVSPVIGVILMVAITVILAAVIATFVLGLGEQVSDTTPNANFQFDYDEGDNGDGELTITHTSGPAIDVDNLAVNAGGTEAKEGSDFVDDGDQVSAGDSVTLDEGSADDEFETGDTVSVIWSNPDGDSATLATFDVPEDDS